MMESSDKRYKNALHIYYTKLTISERIEVDKLYATWKKQHGLDGCLRLVECVEKVFGQDI